MKCISNLSRTFWLFVLGLLLPISLNAKVYLSENFDATDFSSGVPSRWDNTTIYGMSYGMFSWNRFDWGYEGACVRFNSFNSYSGEYNGLMSPAVSIPAGTKAELSCLIKNPTGGKLHILTTMDNGVTFDTLVSNLQNISDWKEVKCSLASYAGGPDVRIVFYSISNYSNGDAYHYLDNFTVQDPPLCAQPQNLYVSSVTQTSVVLNWALGNADTNPDKYQIKVTKSDDGSVVYEDMALMPLSLFTDVTGLEPGTQYDVTLKGDCQSDNKGLSKVSEPFTFKTLHNPVQLPYYEDFDDVSELPSDFYIHGDVSLTGKNKFGNTGNSMQLISDGNNSVIAVFPQAAHPANDMQLSFMLRASVPNVKCSVGIMSDPSDVASFVLLKDIVITEALTWSEVRINTMKYSDVSENQSFAIMLSDTKRVDLCVDNVDIKVIPTCPRPQELNLVKVDSISAIVEWEGKENSLFSQVMLINSVDTTYQIIAKSPAVIGNLAENTIYKVAVRDICSIGDTSEWSKSIQLKTGCRVVPGTQFFQKFEVADMPYCWMQKQIENPSGYGPDYGDNAWVVDGGDYFSAPYALDLKNSKKGIRTLLITQPVFIDSVGKYDLAYQHYRNYSGNSEEGIRIWVNDTPDTTTAELLGFIPSGYQFEPAEDVAGWYRYEYNVKSTGVVYFIFEGICQFASDQYIDDIELYTSPSCKPVNVKSLKLSDITSTSAHLIWTAAQDNYIGYELRYKLLRNSNVVVSDTVSLEAPGFTFTDLNPSSYYSLVGEIAAICGTGGDTSIFRSFNIDFATQCEQFEVPFVESFEYRSFLPLCWSVSKNYNWLRVVNSGYASEGVACAKLDNLVAGSTLLITPLINIPAGDKYEVSFYMSRRDEVDKGKVDSVEGIKVWVNNTPDLVGATMLAYIRSNKEIFPTEFNAGVYDYSVEIPMSGLQYIVFEGICDNISPVYLDNVQVRPVPACTKLRNFSIDIISHDSVMVTVPNVQEWEIEYGVKGFDLGTGKLVRQSAVDNKIKGLNPQTEYDVYIRRVCGDEVSEWSVLPHSFTTPCAPFEVVADAMFFEGFEDLAVGDDVSDCYLKIPKFVDGEQKSVVVNKDEQYNISAFAGERFARQNYGYNAWTYRRLKLKAGVNYEVSGYFIQDNSGAVSSTIASLAVSKNAIYNAETILVSKSVTNKWTFVRAFFTVPIDGFYYVGWRLEQSTPPWVTGMDNLCVKQVNCIPPTDIKMVEKSADGIKFSWSSGASQWEVLVSDMITCDPNNPENVIFRDTVSHACINIDKLSDNTEYYCFFRALCDEGISDWTDYYSFRTDCLPVQVPYNLDFESPNLDELLCWNLDAQEDVFGKSTYISHAGNASLRVRNCTMISPQFDAENMQNYMLEGWVYASADSASFAIGVMIDPLDVSTYEELKVVSIPNKNQWYEFTMYFSDLALPGYEDYLDAKHFVLMINDAATTFNFDDLVFDLTPSCRKPSEPIISEVREESFTLSWNANGGETQWRVIIDKSSGSNIIDTVVTTNPYTFTGLENNTSYEVYIKAVCSQTEESGIVQGGQVTTLCGISDAPYKMLLRKEESGVLPSCWESPDDYANCGWRTYYNNSSISLRTDCYKSGSAIRTAISPIIDLSDTYYPRLILDIRNYYTDSLLVAVQDVNDNIDTLTWVISKESPTSARDTLYLPLDQYIGQQVRFRFESRNSVQYFGSVDIYSMIVDSDLACARPQSVEISNISDTSIVVNIIDTILSHTTWEIACVPNNVAPDMVSSIEVKGSSYTITNLQPRSAYDVYVRTKCDENQYSYWRGPINVMTNCGKTLLPYNESFEQYTTETLNSACFSILNAFAGGSQPHAEINSSKEYVSDGSKLLRLYSSSSHPLYVVLPKFDAPVSKLKIKFDYRNDGESYYDANLIFGIMSSVDDVTSFQPVMACDKKSTISTIAVALDSVVNADFVGYLAFKYIGSYYDNYSVGIDNVRVTSLDDCPFVDNIELVDVEKNKLEIDLVVDRDANEYEIVYDTENVTPDLCANKVKTSSRIVALENLVAGTMYYVYARSICAVGDTTQWSGQYVFSTICDDIVLNQNDLYNENFEKYDCTIMTMPDCMYRLQSATRNGREYPTLETVDPINGLVDFHFYGPNAVVLPKFNLSSDRLLISFKAKGYGDFYIGVTNSMDFDSVRQIDRYYFSYGATTTNLVYDLSNYEQFGTYVVLYTNSYYADVYVDDIKVEWASTCIEPKFLKQEQLSDTSITISWNVCFDAVSNECRLIYGNDTMIIETSYSYLTIDKLLPNTNYSFDVRTHCASGDTTVWSAKHKFRTLSTPARVPYVATFDNPTDNNMWILVNDNGEYGYADAFVVGDKVGEGALYVSDNMLDYVYTGPYCFDEYYQDYDHETFFAYRTIELKVGEYQCDYQWKGSGEKNKANNEPYNFGRLFIMPDSVELSVGDLDYTTKYQTISEPLFDKEDWTEGSGSFIIERDALYRLVVAWDQSFAPSLLSTPLAISNISVSKMPCSNIMNIRIDEIFADSVVVGFDNSNEGGNTEYYIVNGTTLAVDTTSISAALTKLFIGNLLPQTEYTLFVRSVCSQDHHGEWKEISFTTECTPIVVTAENPYFDGFEQYLLGDKVKVELDNCYKQTRTVGVENFMVSNQVSADGMWAFEGDNYAMIGSYTTCSMARQFILNAGNSYRISFYAKQDKQSQDCSASVIITSDYKGEEILFTTNVQDNWVEVIGEYFVAKTGIYSIGVIGDVSFIPKFLCVDNFKVEAVQVPEPTNLTANNIGADSVVLSWSGTTSDYQLQLMQYETLILDTTLYNVDSLCVRNLNSATEYVVLVRAIDDQIKSNWSKIKFMTGCSVVELPYYQSFDAASKVVEHCWDNESGTISTNPERWRVYNKNGNDVLYLPVSYALGLNMIKSEAIDAASGDYVLSFDYMVASQNDKLLVLISNDGGVSFVDTILQSGFTDNVQSCIYDMSSFAGDTIVLAFASNASRIGTSDYIFVDNLRISCLDTDEVIYTDSICPGENYNANGFNIPVVGVLRPGLNEFTQLVRASSSGTDCDYYARLKLYVKEGGLVSISDTICAGDIYVSEAFPDGLTEAGQYQKIMQSSMGCDSIIELTLIIPEVSYEYEHTICQGSDYQFGNRVISEAGVYLDTFVSSSNCDSIVVLKLNVLPSEYIFSEIICEGEQLQWQDTLLTTTGYYKRHYYNYLGCDSVVSVNLVVLPSRVDIDSTICKGKSVSLGSQSYSQSGIYQTLLQNSLGCDSLVVLHLNVLLPDTVKLEDYACEGKPYYGNGLLGVQIFSDTTILHEEVDAEGCVVVKNVSLKFVETVKVDTIVFIKSGEIYDFCGNSLNQAGDYECVMSSQVTGCDSVVNLKLVVSTGVEYLNINPLIIIPNPVLQGEVLILLNPWTDEDVLEIKVEVFDAMGKIVYSDTPKSKPISIPGVIVSGVYTVRVTLLSGQVYVSRLVVK